MKVAAILGTLVLAFFGAASLAVLIVSMTAREMCGWGWSFAL